MKSNAASWLVVLPLLALACGCARRTPEPSHAPVRTITDREWELAALGNDPAARGAGGRPATLRLESATSKAVGFAGCNQYGATYVLSSDSLRFEPPISTRMACNEGMDLESRFLATLPEVVSFRATDSTLELHGRGGPVAGFRAR